MVITATGSEDWDDDEQGQCPECGAIVYLTGDKCPKCGYWYLAEDRPKMKVQSREKSEMRVLKIGVLIIIGASLVIGLVTAIISQISK